MRDERLTCFATRASVSVAGREPEDAEVFARDGRLHVGGARIAYAHAYTVDRIANDDEPNTVCVVGETLTRLLSIALTTTRAAEELLSCLRADAADRHLSVEAGRVSMPWILLITVLGAAVPIGAVIATIENAPFFFGGAVATAVAIVLLARRKKRRITLAADGVSVRELIVTKHVRYGQIQNLERVGDRDVRMTVFDYEVRPASRDASLMPRGLLNVEAREPLHIRLRTRDEREALYFLLVRRRAAANRAAEEAESAPSSRLPAPAPPETDDDAQRVAARLASRGRDAASWLASLTPLTPRHSYREMTPSDGSLTALARDLDADASARLAAAMLLRRRDAEAPELQFDEGTAPAVASAAHAVLEDVAHDRDVAGSLDAFVRALP